MATVAEHDVPPAGLQDAIVCPSLRSETVMVVGESVRTYIVFAVQEAAAISCVVNSVV